MKERGGSRKEPVQRPVLQRERRISESIVDRIVSSGRKRVLGEKLLGKAGKRAERSPEKTTLGKQNREQVRTAKKDNKVIGTEAAQRREAAAKKRQEKAKKELEARKRELDGKEKDLLAREGIIFDRKKEAKKSLRQKAGDRFGRARDRFGRFIRKPKEQTVITKKTEKKTIRRESNPGAVLTAAAALLAVALLAGICSNNPKLLESFNRPTPAGDRTPTPSSAAGTAGDAEKAKAEAQAKADAAAKAEAEKAKVAAEAEKAKTASADAFVNLEKKYVKGQETEAAARFGGDSYSKNPSHVTINEFGGVTVNPDNETPKGANDTHPVTRMRPNGTVLETWLEVPQRPENTAHNAIVFVVHPGVEKFDGQAGTFWDFGLANANAGVRQLNKQLTERELIGRDGKAPEQPGVKIINICPPLGTDGPFVGLERRIASKPEAASMFGVDSYSKNPDNWEINEFGGATLKPDPSGKVTRIKTNGATVEGWIKLNQRIENSKFDAEVFVLDPELGEMDLQGGTFWKFSAADRVQSVKQLTRQLTERELIGRDGKAPEQPGVNIAYACPLPTASQTPAQAK